MLKLLNKYRSDRSVQNARSLVAYVRDHPMALCLADRNDCAAIDEAEQLTVLARA